MTRTFAATLVLGTLGIALAAQAGTPPIVAVKAKPNEGAFKDSSWKAPLILKSADEAAKYFDKDALEAVKKQVDFQKQFVLLFAWKGSGQDKLTYAVAESFPEQIFFTYKPGATDDLRSHVHVYALRSNVRWGFTKKGAARGADLQSKDEKSTVRPVKFSPKDPTIAFKIGGQNKLTVMENAGDVEKFVGKGAAKTLIDAVDFQKEKLVLVSWSTSGPPDGTLKHDIKKGGDASSINFFVQGPPGAGARGQRLRLGTDFFAVPRDAKVTFDPKER